MARLLCWAILAAATATAIYRLSNSNAATPTPSPTPLVSTPSTQRPIRHQLTKDLGVIVLRETVDRPIDFRVPTSMQIPSFEPQQVSVGRVCCTFFELHDENWNANPGGVMTVSIPPVKTDSIWTAKVKGKDGEYEFIAKANVLPVIRFMTGLPRLVVRQKGVERLTETIDVAVVRSVESPPTAPDLEVDPKLTATWGQWTNSRAVDAKWIEDQFPLEIVIPPNNTHLAVMEMVRLRDRKSGFVIELPIIVEPAETVTVEPRALVWKLGEQGADFKVITIRSNDGAPLSCTSFSASATLLLGEPVYSDDLKTLTLRVQCTSKKRGSPGEVTVKLSNGVAMRIPAFVLAEG